MKLPRTRAFPAVLLICISGIVAVAAGEGSVAAPAAPLAADPGDPFLDSDNDLLPDLVERMTLTHPGIADTFGSGAGDFVAAVLHELPQKLDGSQRGYVVPPPKDARAIISVARFSSDDYVMMTVLLRLPHQDAGELRLMMPFIDIRGLQVPIPTLVSSSIMHVRQRVTPHGTLVAISSRVARVQDVLRFAPCTLAAQIAIGGTARMPEMRTILSGGVIVDVGSMPVSVVPVDESAYAFQTLVTNPQDPGHPFWEPNNACVFQLVQVGTTGSGILAEVTSARCEGMTTLFCDAVGCASKEGTLLPIPDTFRTLRGF